eukprot:4248435-Pleurochrysis_carterae.AAC.2
MHPRSRSPGSEARRTRRFDERRAILFLRGDGGNIGTAFKKDLRRALGEWRESLTGRSRRKDLAEGERLGNGIIGEERWQEGKESRRRAQGMTEGREHWERYYVDG